MSLNGKWCMSDNGVDFTGIYDTKEIAIKEAKRCSYRFIGQCILNFEPYIDPDDIIEKLQDEAYDVGGEHAETYLEGVTKEQKKELGEELNKVLKKWLEKYGYEVNFYAVENIVNIKGVR